MEEAGPKHSSLTGTIVILAGVGIVAAVLVLWPLLHKSQSSSPVPSGDVTAKDDEPTVAPLTFQIDAPAPSTAEKSRVANSQVNKPEAPKRIHIGGSSGQQQEPIYQPKPEYPQIARSVHVQGTVRLEVVIGTDGAIQEVKLISGHPLLINSAINAVRQWRYKPTLLTGQPVEVETEVDVNFNLAP